MCETKNLVDNIFDLIENNFHNFDDVINNLSNKYNIHIKFILYYIKNIVLLYYPQKGNIIVMIHKKLNRYDDYGYYGIFHNYKYNIFKPINRINCIKYDKYVQIINEFKNDYKSDLWKNIIIESNTDRLIPPYILISNMVEYSIFNKDWKFFECLLYYDDLVYLSIIKKLSPYLSLIPRNIFCELMKKYKNTPNNLFNIIKISYYVSYKLKHIDFIDFDNLDKLYLNKLLYTTLLLNHDGHVNIINNNKVVKYYSILNKLPLDLQLEICGLISINIKNIKKSIKYLCS